MKKIVPTAGCKRRRAEIVNAWIDRRVLFALAFLALLALAAYAAPPAWWGAQGVINGKAANDYAVANQGQLKNMAKAARAELVARGHFQLTDANAINALVDGWSANTERAMDYAPVNLGQLKAVAKPFYDALYLAYPWSAASASANDHAVANIGQLKAVFAFNVGPFDTDGDGLPDAWETKMFGDLGQGPGEDSDSDGLSNLVEWQKGIDPDNALSDEDGDGMLSVWEVQHQLQPLNPADAGLATGRMERPSTPQPPNVEDYQNPEVDAFTQQLLYEDAMAQYQTAMAGLAPTLAAYDMVDPDGDGLSNLREFLAGTNPRARSSDGDIYSDYEEVTYGSDPLLAASIPPVRVEFSQLSASVILVATFRAEHVAGGETVTLHGGAGTLFFAPAPNSAVVTPGQVTVTTDATYGLALVNVFAPAGPEGSQAVTVAAGGAPVGSAYAMVALAWQGSVGGTLDPPGPPLPGGPTPHSPPPDEGLVFTAHRAKSLLYFARQTVSHPTRETGAGGGVDAVWTKPGPPPAPPPYSDDGFNGDGDLEGNNEDPGDPRDEAGVTGAGRVAAEPGDDGAEVEYFYTAGMLENIGPYSAPGSFSGEYEARDAYTPPSKTARGSGQGGFEHGKAVSTLDGMSFSRGGNESGWMGNGPLGVNGYTATSTLTIGRGEEPLITYRDQITGELLESTATYDVHTASMTQFEVRLQTNKDVEEGKPVSATFVLTKTTVAESQTTSEFLATLLLTINSGKKSDACEVLAGELPSDVTKQGGVVSMRSPPPVPGQTISYTLLPFEAVSRDKFLAGSFNIPLEWDDAAIEFIGPNGENLGKYGDLLGGGSTKVYDSVTDILGEADVAAGGQSSDQKVWFVREGSGSRKISFYTCFNAVGQARIKLYPDEDKTAAVTLRHDLVAAEDFAGVIGYIDAWVKGTSFNWSVPYESLSGPVLALASQAADDPSAAGFSPVAVASSLVSGAIVTADTNVPLAPDTVDLALGQPLSSAPSLGGQAALQILPLDAIQLQNPLPLVPGTVYWLAGGVLYPLAEAQVTTLGEQAGSLTLAAPPPASAPPPTEGTSYGFAGTGNTGPIDNLTRAALIPFFNVICQVEGLGNVVVGVLEGVKGGLKDDWEFLQLIAMGLVDAGSFAVEQAKTELQKWKTDPYKRACELKRLAEKLCEEWVFKPLEKYWQETGQELWRELCTERGFRDHSWKIWRAIKGAMQLLPASWTAPKDIWGGIVDELTDWADDFCGRMMTGSEKAHWDSAPWVMDNLLSEVSSVQRQACYTFGYVFGYLCEQVAVGFATDGVLKVAQVAAKGGAILAASLAKRTAAAVAAWAHMLKRLLAETAELPAEIFALFQQRLSWAGIGPTGEGMTKVPLEVLQEGAESARFNPKQYLDCIFDAPKTNKFLRQGDAAAQKAANALLLDRMAQMKIILGDEFTEAMQKNLMKVIEDFILVRRPDGAIDEFFEGFLRAMEGNPSLMRHADDTTKRFGGSLEPMSANAKARLKQILSDPEPGNPWKLDTPEEWNVDDIPIPSNFYARGLLLELHQFKKVYKPAGFKHHPTAPGFDCSSAADDLFVQIKTLKNPDGAFSAMKKAVDKLAAAIPNGAPVSVKIKLHIIKRPGSSSSQLEAQIAAYIAGHAKSAHFVPSIVEEFVYP